MNTFYKLKRYLTTLILVIIALSASTAISPETAHAQEITPGVDLYSTYVFRGIAFSGPAVQPYVDFTAGGFTLGAWGSQGIDGSAQSGNVGFQEMDLYASYSFDFGLTIGATDYYYPPTEYLDGESHAFELNAGLDIEELSLSGNVVLNEADFAGSAGGDLYFEAGYDVGSASLFVGGGDGWHSSDGDFAIVNTGIGTSKEIEITDTFSIPVSAAVIFNPDIEQFFVLVGLTL
ncbi:MAG: hypothetical protein GVY08_08780 [Bacteroidetes bacterium]|jgi:uncharacterized protein (TIGR02001 family)|nr:hypothetical protein [Bacteroidota bacterium]